MQYVELAAIAEAVQALRSKLPTADETLREKLSDTLLTLRELANKTLDAWMSVDEAIEETYALLESPSVAKDAMPSETPSDNGTMVESGDALDSPYAEGLFDLSAKYECQLRKGLAYYDLRMFDHAAKTLSDAIDEADCSGDSLGAMIYVALSQLHAGHLDEAKQTLATVEAAVDADDEIVLQALLEVRTFLHASERDWQNAIHTLYNLLDFDSDRGEVWFNLGVCHIHLGEFAAAERCFAQSHARTDDEEALLWRALALVWAGNGRAAKTIAEIIPPTASTVKCIRLRVMLLLAVGLHQHALMQAREYQRHQDNLALGLYLEALCCVVMGSSARASVLCKRALTIAPDDLPLTALLGCCLYLIGDYDRSEGVLANLANQLPSVPGMVSLLLGRLAIRSHDTHLAMKHLHAAAKSSQTSIRRLAALYQAVVYERRAESEDLVASLQRAVQLGVPADVLRHADGP
ncbi:tetratricopeptide repeat protein [Alicyclobacillus acidiphilus]|uniref:tetratricopeptide repeat protein n=1 Tax=Alicyclobacillus acidiphilus TaxID=182455 RepID=UPI000832FC75|nr:tetratricopeptide repeat protein [Alicyclobacillus acidiphilus]